MKPGDIVKFDSASIYWSPELRGKLGVVIDVRPNGLYGSEGPEMVWDVLIDSKVLKNLLVPLAKGRLLETIYEAR